jgi:hypothetical protein
MDGIRVIPTNVHGVLDYVVGIALIAAPWIFGFADNDAAMWSAIGAGVAVLATSVMTRYEWGLARVIPMPAHLGADMVVGAFLIASPWLFGFSDDGTNAWLPHVLVGIAEIGVALMTERVPRRRDLARDTREPLRRAA